MSSQHIEGLRSIVRESEHGQLNPVEGLTGFSGEKLVGLLQRLARRNEELGSGCYLEVGVFQGLTLLSVASVIRGPAYGIDNFAQFDASGKNQSIIQERARRLSLTNARLINADYEDALEKIDRYLGNEKVGTFFVDGPHDYRSQLMCLELIRDRLTENGVIVVDDANYRHVRLATRDFLVVHPEFKLLFEAYTRCHPHNLDESSRDTARKGWWNGVHVIVRDTKNDLSAMYPPTLRDRIMYENEHLIHSHRLGALAPEALDLAESLARLRLIRAARQAARLTRKVRQLSSAMRGEFARMNTYSSDLPARVNG